jgi:tight adherence protein C
VSALLIAASVLLGGLSIRRRAAAVDLYLGVTHEPARRRWAFPSVGSAAAGAASGVIAAIALDPGSALTLGLVGALGGMLVSRSIRSTARQRLSKRLALELPTVSDTIALHVLSGESIGTAVRRFAETSDGVASAELRAVVASGRPLDESLRAAARETAHPQAVRLYDLLAHAHRTGGSLAPALSALAADYRAATIRELTAEGGRRALAAYGPILALMVPVTLLFLMYPALAGLNSLSSTP